VGGFRSVTTELNCSTEDITILKSMAADAWGSESLPTALSLMKSLKLGSRAQCHVQSYNHDRFI
jgi:hypothetical protein